MTLRYYIEGATDHWSGAVVPHGERAMSPRQHARFLRQRDAYERRLRDLIRKDIAAGVFVPYDPQLVGPAIFGTLNRVLTWYNPGGERSAKEMAGVLSWYLVRGPQAHPQERPESRMPSSGRPSMQRVFNGPADA